MVEWEPAGGALGIAISPEDSTLPVDALQVVRSIPRVPDSELISD